MQESADRVGPPRIVRAWPTAGGGNPGATVEVGFIDRSGAPDLFLRKVRPAVPRARLAFVHASLVHSEYYVPFALRLADLGIETWLPDLTGHGRSGGTRGYTRSWGDAVADAAAVFAAMAESADVPLWVGGESYGALVTYSAVQRGLIGAQACLFLSPAFGIHFRPSRSLWWILSRIGLPAFGRLRPVLRLTAEGITRDPMVARAIRRDALCNHRYTLAFLVRMMQVQYELQRPDPAWRTPTLMLLSAEDPITDNDVSREMFRGNPLVAVREAQGALHSLVADLPQWAAQQVGRWVEAAR